MDHLSSSYVSPRATLVDTRRTKRDLYGTSILFTFHEARAGSCGPSKNATTGPTIQSQLSVNRTGEQGDARRSNNRATMLKPVDSYRSRRNRRVAQGIALRKLPDDRNKRFVFFVCTVKKSLPTGSTIRPWKTPKTVSRRRPEKVVKMSATHFQRVSACWRSCSPHSAACAPPDT